jgi:hypothetical protein
MPEQLVCTVDEMNVQGAASTQPYKPGLRNSTNSGYIAWILR